MRRYFNNARPHVAEQSRAVARAERKQVFTHEQLSRVRTRYNLDDGMEVGAPEEDPRSAEDEYIAYVAQRLSPRRTDPLKFWEVRRT